MSFSLQAKPTQRYRMFDFTGGLNTKYTENALADRESPDLNNVVLDERGMIYKRPGVVIDPNYPQKTTAGIMQMETFMRRDNTVEKFIFFNDGTVKGINSAGTVYDLSIYNAAGTLITHSNKRFSAYTYGNTFYFGNKTDGWFKYTTGTRADGVSSIPKCDFAIVKGERVYYAGEENQPDRLHYSHLGEPENVSMTKGTDDTDATVGGLIDFLSQDVPITGITVFQDDLLVFKKDAVFGLSGDNATNFVVNRLNVETGCIAPGSIINSNNLVYYLGYDGVYFIHSPEQRQLETKPISERITEEFDGVDPKEIQGVYYKSALFLFMPQKTLIFNERLGAWSKWDLDMNDAHFDEHLDQLILGNDNGIVYTLKPNAKRDEYTANTYTAISATFSTPYLSLEEPETTKRFKWVKMFFKPNDIDNSIINVRIDIDYADQYKDLDVFYDALVWESSATGSTDLTPDDENVWGEYWGDMREQKSDQLRFGGSGEYIKFTFSNSELDCDMGIYGFVIGFKKKSKVR